MKRLAQHCQSFLMVLVMEKELIYLKKQLSKIANEFDISRYKDLINDNSKRKIILRANQLLREEFIFDNNWDMEPSIKKHRLHNYNYETIKENDPEWCYMLNRFDWLINLILAGEITADAKYFNKAKKYILLWIDQNKEIVSKKSTRTLDTGIRISNFTQALIYLYKEHAITDQEIFCIRQSVFKQCEYLKKMYISRYKLSNWGIIQLCGILEIYPIIKENYVDDPLYNWAIRELICGLKLQILPDGIDWERSPMYQGEILLSMLKMISKYHILGVSSNSNIESYTCIIAKGLKELLTSAGILECFGDSDCIYATDLFEMYSVIFKYPIANFCKSKEIPYDTLYLLGSNVQKIYDNLKVIEPTNNFFDGKYSGLYTIRESWKINSNFLLFNNGSLGSGHSHCDNLHFILSIKGKPLIIDSGRYSYKESFDLRTKLKSMKMHNSVIIDNNEYCKPLKSWTFSNFGTPLPIYSNHLNQVDYLEGTIIGNNPLQVWTRKIVVIKQNIYVIIDEIREDGKHEMDTYFHVDNSVELSVENTDIICKTDSFTYKIIRSNSKYEYLKEVASTKYNQIHTQKVIKFTDNFKDKIFQATIIAPKECKVCKKQVINDHGKNSYKELVDAWGFEYNGENWSLAIVHDEMYKGKNLMFLNNIPFHAHAVVFDTTDKLQSKNYILKV